MQTVERIRDGQKIVYDCVTNKLFLRSSHPVDMPMHNVQEMHAAGMDIVRAVQKAMDLGYDVEIVRNSVPPWAMGRVQTHVRIWPNPHKQADKAFDNPHHGHGPEEPPMPAEYRADVRNLEGQ